MGSQQHTVKKPSHTTMVKLQFPPPEKEDRLPMLRTKSSPQLLPVTIKETRRRNENDRAVGLLSFLGSVLLFIGFLMILFSIKSVWDLKIENWRLCKENAALKKTVRDNVAVEKFTQHIPSEAEILEFERPVTVEPPKLSWSVSVQIFWSSPFITPCDMNWLARELADQIYDKKKELDEEKMVETMEIQEIQENQVEEMLEIESENSPNMDIVEEFEVENGGPLLKSPEDTDLKNGNGYEDQNNEELNHAINEDQQTGLHRFAEGSGDISDLYFNEEDEFFQNDKISPEELKNEEMMIDEIANDKDIEFKPDDDNWN